jgi:hypothetical protein
MLVYRRKGIPPNVYFSQDIVPNTLSSGPSNSSPLAVKHAILIRKYFRATYHISEVYAYSSLLDHRRAAYNDLPQEKKDLIEDLIIEHSIWHSRKIAAPGEFSNLSDLEMSLKPPAVS